MPTPVCHAQRSPRDLSRRRANKVLSRRRPSLPLPDGRRKRHSFHHELWHMVRATPSLSTPHRAAPRQSLASRRTAPHRCQRARSPPLTPPTAQTHATHAHATRRSSAPLVCPQRHAHAHPTRMQVDFHLLGNAFESYDAEWAVHNPPGFKYGHGGKHMRSDSSSSQLSSSPSEEFLNRYGSPPPELGPSPPNPRASPSLIPSPSPSPNLHPRLRTLECAP
jgi:hypothetical protein